MSISKKDNVPMALWWNGLHRSLKNFPLIGYRFESDWRYHKPAFEISMKTPSKKIRNPHAISASFRKAGRMVPKAKKRLNGKNKNTYYLNEEI
jgi:hypothetical protein